MANQRKGGGSVEDNNFNGDNDFMELSDTGWVPIMGGWFFNNNTKEYMNPNGEIADPFELTIVDDPLEG